jgi:serpin B
MVSTRAPGKLLALISLPGCLLIGACSGGAGANGTPAASSTTTPPAATGDEARSALGRDEAPQVTAADQASLEASNAAFAFDLYAALRQPGHNLFFSPYSVTSALAMTYAGARGGTAAEMAGTMHLALPAERVGPAFDWLDLQLASRAATKPAGEGAPFTLNVANALWGERSESWHPAFLDTLAVDYGASVRLADLRGDPAGALAAMDAWVSAQTGGRIAHLLPGAALDAGTRLVVANAVLFQASWATPFHADKTAPATFTRGDGTTATVDTMHANAHMLYAQGADGAQLVELPYVGQQVAMDVVLPAAGGDAAFDAGLSADRFASLVAALSSRQVDLALPKVDVAGETLALSAALGKLGMPSLFGSGADLSGMTDDALWLHQVFHQSALTVDENGTLAAAATAGISPTHADAPTPMTVDRPFFVAVRDVPTGTILFAGKIESP